MKIVGKVAAQIAGIIAAVALTLGWVGGYDTPKRISDDFVAMAPSTAICFLLLIGAILNLFKSSDMRHRVEQGLLWAVIALASINLAISLGTGNSGIDAVMFFGDNDHTSMALATSILFLLASISTLEIFRNNKTGRLGESCAILGLLVAMIALAGYLFDAEALYGVFFYSVMALNTAVAFFCVFVAILLARPQGTWVDLLLADAPGSRAARRLLPLFVGASIALCYVTLLLVEARIFDVNFRLSLLAISMSVLAAVSLLWGAADVNRADGDRLKALSKLQGANDDKALLLREVYHRVKNNLQQIAAMLRIERRKLSEPGGRESYDAVIERVRTMGLVHQLLISSDRPSAVPMDEFLSDLIAGIGSSHDLKARGIGLSLAAEPLALKVDAAISIGLLVNEIVTNAIKHAFPDGRQGKIEVSFGRAGQDMQLMIVDNGVGMRGDAVGSGTGSLIVSTMASQIEGTVIRESEAGTRVTIGFPADINDKGNYT